jgi:hypothetical protein
MSKLDRKAANALAEKMLARRNPPDPDVDEVRVTLLFHALTQQGIQISSLTESDLRRHCKSMGLSETATVSAIEEAASWGVTDDVFSDD